MLCGHKQDELPEHAMMHVHRFDEGEAGTSDIECRLAVSVAPPSVDGATKLCRCAAAVGLTAGRPGRCCGESGLCRVSRFTCNMVR